VAVVMTLYLLGGVASLVAALLVQTLLNRIRMMEVYKLTPRAEMAVPVLVVIGILYFAIGLALLSGRQWARMLAILFSSLSVLGVLINFASGILPHDAKIMSTMVFQLVVNLLIVILFSGRPVQEWFAYQTNRRRQRSNRSPQQRPRRRAGARRRVR